MLIAKRVRTQQSKKNALTATAKHIKLLAGISAEFGLECALKSDSYLNGKDFCALIHELKSKFEGKFAIFWDNTPYHILDYVKGVFRQ
jgi:hypothetical protein